MPSIPFNRFCPVGTESGYLKQAVDGIHVSGDGPFTKRCQRLLEQALGANKVLLTTSCTHALEMAALLLDVGPGDEVIVPSFTFVSTANAFALRGARVVFADVRGDTLNLDERQLPRLVTSRTKAIVPVHYGGVACEMDPIAELASDHDIAIVEDNAHGLFGQYRGRPLGTLGELAALSFHETKNFSCGEGGALMINDERFVRRAELIREKGTNRSRFFRGEVDKYTWVDLGSSYAPSDLLAAILYAQLEAREAIQSKRRRVWDFYYQSLTSLGERSGVRLPIVPSHCDNSYHLFYLLMPTAESRQSFISHLKSQGILSVFHYLPLHLSEMGRRLGGQPGDCPVAEDVSGRLVRLPFYNDLQERDQSLVVDAVRRFFETSAVAITRPAAI